MRLSELTENRIAASAHAILYDALFTVLGCRLFISAAASARGQERISADPTVVETKSTTAGDTHARILVSTRVFADCGCRLLACGNVAVICLLGMAAHVDYET